MRYTWNCQEDLLNYSTGASSSHEFERSRDIIPVLIKLVLSIIFVHNKTGVISKEENIDMNTSNHFLNIPVNVDTLS